MYEIKICLRNNFQVFGICAIENINAAILLIEHKTTKMHSIMQMHQYLLHSRQNQNFLKLNESKSI